MSIIYAELQIPYTDETPSRKNIWFQIFSKECKLRVMEMHYAEEYVDEKENNKSSYWQ